MIWDELTSSQLEKLDKKIPVVLPIAATEQHGPHLPLATDRLIGMHFCHSLNKNIKDQVLILPAMGIGCSEHHLDFGGTLSYTHETFLKSLTDIANCIVLHGFKNLIVFNSHGGNQGIAQTFVEQFGYRNPNCKILLISWWNLAKEALKEISSTGPGGTGHAGEFETSLMLLIAPELVKTDLIPPRSNRPSYPWAEGDLLSGPRISFYQTMREKTPSGALGEPQQSTSEKGRQITKVVVSQLRQVILDLSD